MLDTALKADKDNKIVFKNQDAHISNDESEILSGLQASSKTINPKFFYDTYGSELFEQITSLPEYYLTRAERSILTKYSKEIASYCGKDSILIEPGSGSSEKIRLLLNDLRPETYLPIDIAAEFLQRSAEKLAEEYPWLNINAICSDFSHHQQTAKSLPDGKRIIFYPGSTLGNMIPDAALDFMSGLRTWLDEDGGMIVGVDLHKSKDILDAAYNDKLGITAKFNLNVLENINRIANATFDLDNFDHNAFYNQNKRRIEMHLVSKLEHTVQVAGDAITFSKGESIHTENSYKYTLEDFKVLVGKSGFKLETSWYDDKKLFAVHYLSVK